MEEEGRERQQLLLRTEKLERVLFLLSELDDLSDAAISIMDGLGDVWTENERLFAATGMFFYQSKVDGWPEDVWAINLNDVWYYASGDAERVDPVDYHDVADLLRSWGDSGLLYWVYKKRGHLPMIPKQKKRVEWMIKIMEEQE